MQKHKNILIASKSHNLGISRFVSVFYVNFSFLSLFVETIFSAFSISKKQKNTICPKIHNYSYLFILERRNVVNILTVRCIYRIRIII